MRQPTPYPDLNAVLGELVASIRAVLADSFVAAYLQGSFAVGDFDLHSDVDFVIAVAETPSGVEIRDLQGMHGRIFDLECAWAQHLEGSYFPADVLRSCDRRGEDLWFLDNGGRSLARSDHCNTVVVRQTVREHGITLAGPEPTTLIDPIPVKILRDEIRGTIIDWGREILEDPDRFNNRFYQGFILLSYCRMLRDLHDGAVGSKLVGAEWAKANLSPEWAGLIDRAWDTRPNPEVSVRTPADPDDFQRTLEFVAVAMQASKITVD